MAQQNKSHVPKFGNWEKEGNVPYTLYFENARKGKGGKMINPNDPAENPEAFSSSSSSVAAPSPNRSSEGGGRSTPPPPQHQSPNPYARDPPPPRRGRASGGGGYSVEQSPVHPYSNKAAGDYSSESAAAGYGLVANSVDRSRGRSGGGGGSRGNETPTRGSAVPKFGDWDSNPASADGYTHIFNKVREEKQTQTEAGRGRSAGHGRDAARGNGGKHHGDDGYVSSSKFSCFGWCK
ncbi:hypothetical protein QOZ80_8BG0666480 [Eleusine coracana subsp. coracana]|nr:hypothetical protein QOZ80_8BG0666480 [Eleusine coracana subsp. coracana]